MTATAKTANQTRTKICGIQRPEEALVAAEAGVDFIGLVFVPGRRRRLEVAAAADIAATMRAAGSRFDRPAPQAVGLFADQPLAEVQGVIKAGGLDAAQLCGQESPEYCRQVQGETGASVIKVLHISGAATIGATEGSTTSQRDAGVERRLLDYQEAGCYITLDRLVEGLQGGTGESFDWDVAAQLSQRGYQFLLAGGLTPDNVAQAVAQARPWGVDVSTGVETDGVKDPEKIRSFIQNARGVKQESIG